MATKKETPEVKETPKQTDPWKITRKIYIPKGGMGEDPYLLIGVNSRFKRFKRGETVDAELPYAEIIERKVAAENAEEDYQRKVDGKNFNIGNEAAEPTNL